jgi:ABC-type transport system substrate-binding protein
MKVRHVILPALILSVFLLSCGNNKNETDKAPGSADSVEAGANTGNNFYLNEIDHYLTLYPHSITDLVSANIAYQIYEGLVGFNPKDLSIVPSIAEKWEMDETGKKYTFHLKKGVKFQDDPCFEGGKAGK